MIRTLTIVTVLTLSGIASAADEGRLRFNQDVRPMLSDKCFACHGFDAKKRKGDLRLDTPEGAYAVNDDAQAIKPGDLAKSELWKRINSTDDDEVMPPPESHKKLTPQEKALFKRWIEEGAAYEKHWAFEVPVKADPPAIQKSKFRIQNPIDAFIGDRLEREGLDFSPEADRETLIRRVAFAVTGLPPTVKEVGTASVAMLGDKVCTTAKALGLIGPLGGETVIKLEKSGCPSGKSRATAC